MAPGERRGPLVVPAGFRSEPLEGHDRTHFSCGDDALDRYFGERAGQDRERNLAAPFVLVEVSTGTVAGYYTLSSSSVEAARLPGNVTKRLPKYRELPAILIGRLAVDRRYQGQDLGRRLVYDALQRCLLLSHQLGAFAVLVDAKNETARGFWEHLGFIPLEDHPLQLFIPTSSVSRLLLSAGIAVPARGSTR